ncbi:MAG: hypothetical protein DMF61_03970 [Blastocatellia bacterium AA13]|nr:MAG: hypothetical protein DMF61_03970 [Blastocatellia bacterium AA13]
MLIRKLTIRKLTMLLFCSVLAVLFLTTSEAKAQERLCDSSFEDCRQPLWDLIDAETQGIDFSFWFIQDSSYATKLINKFHSGVPVRVLCDPRASATYAGNQAILDQLKNAGIPMRYKLRDGILHFKMMLFAGQNKLEFTGANYSPDFFVPAQPFTNYIDEAIYFTDDPAVVNSFKTKYDDLWTDTTSYGNYANITTPLARRYPTFPIDPEMNFPPSVDDSQDFYNRTALEMNQEPRKIDIIMYRITNDRYTNTSINAVNRGIPVRLLTEQNEYRNPDRPWDAYNVDLLYNGGVQIRIRAHQGLNHEKVVMLYGLGETIFGSSNWTGPSSNSQQENNYFTKKQWFFNWFVNQFERKWNSNTETQPFAPLPPDPPQYISPANGSTGQSLNTTLTWEGGPYAHKFDIYFGTTPDPPLLAADQFIGKVDNGMPETYTLPQLQPGTKYYWRLVSKTMANQTASGAVLNFTTVLPPPTVSAAAPNSGPIAGGASVTITGTNFSTGATVKFGGAAATNVNVSGSTSITATTPSHAAGPVDVVVTTPGGTGTLTSGYTYVAPSGPAPTVTAASPSSGPTNGGTAITLTGTNFASGATVTIGGTAATNVAVTNATTITATTPAHTAGAVNVVVTNTDGQSGTLTNGFTYNAIAPGAGDVVLYASEATVKAGNWQTVSDQTAAGGARIFNQDRGGAKLAAALAAPTDYFEMRFNADAGKPYRIWMRGIAQNDSPFNDSVFIQFSDSVDSGGAAIDRIGTTSSEAYNLEDCSGCGLSGWGWQDNGWGVGVFGPLIYFQSTGVHTIRIQVREDGLSIDQILLSPSTFLNNSPGSLKNDTMIMAKSGSATAPPPSVASISPSSGSTAGGTSVTISGSNFFSGATVTIGGANATGVTVVSSTSITAVTPPHAAGTAGVTVTNTDGQSSTLANAFTYSAPTNPAPSVTSVSPNSGSASGGTAVTISGSNFVAGASVTFGGTAATGVTVVNGTTITATTPAHAAGAVTVTVTNSDGQSGSLTNAFTYSTPTNPAPSVTSVSPNSGSTVGGTSVTISGSNFLAGASVSFGGTSAAGITVVNATTITATTPSHAAGSVNVVVTNSDGQSGTLTGGFTYSAPANPAPTVTSASPSSGPDTGGTAVTISGTGFLAGATVKFGGTAATNVNVVNGTSITATTPAHIAGAADVVVTNTDGQSGGRSAAFTYVGGAETVLLADDFNDNSLDTAKWVLGNLFSGFTDSTVTTGETNQHIEIGPLKVNTDGSHYNGVRSAASYNFTGAYCYVELLQAPASNTAGDAMFTVGIDSSNYYRIYVEAGSLFLQKRLGGAKTALLTLGYNAANHKFLRIRHDSTSGNVVFETAPDSGGVPGAWTVLYSEAWNNTSIPLTAVQFELKAGTWQIEANAAGKVIFDNFKAAKP